MTKNDLIWVVIRGAGFILVVRAILVLPDIASAFTWNFFMGPPSSDATETGRMLLASARNSLVNSLMQILVYGSLGIYLLRWGAWIHRILRHVTPERSNTTPHTDARDAPPSAGDGAARAGGRER
jgi:hypothetical protein